MGEREDWRLLWGPDGPGQDAPMADKQRFFRLRLAELRRETKALFDLCIKGEGAEGEATYDDYRAYYFKARSIAGSLDALNEQTKSLGARPGPDGGESGADIIALADELCRIRGLDWEPPDTGAVKRDIVVGDEGPTPDMPLNVKRTWFQRRYALAGVMAKQIETEGAAASSKIRKDLIHVADSALKTFTNILRQTARLCGADAKRDGTARESLIDVLAQELVIRQRIAGDVDPKVIRGETVTGYVRDVLAARSGDFEAYLKINGFVSQAESPENRTPIDIAECHQKMIRALLADLICRKCGHFHLGSHVPTYDVAEQRQYVAPVTCPHCGAEDCGGVRNHRLAAPRGSGKTDMSALAIAFRCGLYLSRGYLPQMVIIGSNKNEAHRRLGKVSTVMRWPGHGFAFPLAVPIKKPPGETLRLRGKDQPTFLSFGIESMPPGTHADYIFCDDVVNEDNTFRVPAKMQVVLDKLNLVIGYSKQPWTVMDWITTVWRADDPDHKLERYAEDHPAEWVNCVITAGGPDDDPEKAFASHWPARFSVAMLKALYENDDHAYRLGMMMQRVNPSDIVFQRFGLWLNVEDRGFDKVPHDLLKDYLLVRRTEVMRWPMVMGVDLAYTGPKAIRKTGRSETAFCVVAVNPWTKVKLVLHSSSAHISPGMHKRAILNLASEFHLKTVAIEADKTTQELVEELQECGLDVEIYSPAALGSKENRKSPVAAWFNAGTALLHGKVTTAGDGWKIEPLKTHQRLKEAGLLFPTKCPDILDALEIATRTADRYWGGPPEVKPADTFSTKRDSNSERLARALAALYDGTDKKPVRTGAFEDDAAEIMAGMDDVFASAAADGVFE